MKKIHEYDTVEGYYVLKDICNRIYIARNIALSQEGVIKELEKIDALFRDGGEREEL